MNDFEIKSLRSNIKKSASIELASAASSEISDSLRNQILGVRPRHRRNRADIPVTPPKSKPLNNSIYSTPLELAPIQESVVRDHSFDSNRIPQKDSNRTNRSAKDMLVEKVKVEEKKLQSAETQTASVQTTAIQTSATGTDALYSCEKCCCKMCSPPNCCYGPPPDEVEASEITSIPDTIHTTEVFQNYRCNCKCGNWSDFDSASDISDSDRDTNCLDLSYQTNEDYLLLLQELENKLITRNRNRVRKTMQEFERRSRRNQNLKKPICNYDSYEEIEFIKKPLCGKCGRKKKKKVGAHLEKCKGDTNFDRELPESKLEASPDSSHWRLNPRTGEWVKMSGFEENEGRSAGFKREKRDNSGGQCRKECCCRAKK